MSPKDPDSLIQRATCSVEVSQFDSALQDIEKVFEILKEREGITDCSHMKSR